MLKSNPNTTVFNIEVTPTDVERIDKVLDFIDRAKTPGWVQLTSRGKLRTKTSRAHFIRQAIESAIEAFENEL